MKVAASPQLYMGDARGFHPNHKFESRDEWLGIRNLK